MRASEVNYSAFVTKFVGGYTVDGNSFGSVDGFASFSVEQECLCQCNASTTGIFCRGGNPGNAFIALAYFNEAGEWQMQQTSLNATPSYSAIFNFGIGIDNSGGAHSATGYTEDVGGSRTVFRAQQSAIGCTEGSGASSCLALCGSYGIPTAQIRDRCDL